MSSFTGYQASREDFEAIEDALNIVWHPKMRFVFSHLSKIANTVVVSYDSQFIYIWSPRVLKGLIKLECGLRRYKAYKIPHRVELKEKWQYAWCSGIWDEGIQGFLPENISNATRFAVPRISGGLLTPFVELQERINGKGRVYTTKESFLATIIHEFGHVYWDQHKLWYYSDKKENFQYLKLAKRLYQGADMEKITFRIPAHFWISELFAFCTEYYASALFLPEHQRNLDALAGNRLDALIKEEKRKDLEKEDSVLEPWQRPHDFALVFGKIFLSKYPEVWPKILTDPERLGTIF